MITSEKFYSIHGEYEYLYSDIIDPEKGYNDRHNMVNYFCIIGSPLCPFKEGPRPKYHKDCCYCVGTRLNPDPEGI